MWLPRRLADPIDVTARRPPKPPCDWGRARRRPRKRRWSGLRRIIRRGTHPSVEGANNFCQVGHRLFRASVQPDLFLLLRGSPASSACVSRKGSQESDRGGRSHGGGSFCACRGGDEDDDGGGGGRERAQLLRAAVGAAALLPHRPAAAVPPRRRHRQARRRLRRRARRTRCGGCAAVRGGEPQAQLPPRHRESQGALRAGERRCVRGGGRGRQERALRCGGEAPRRDARRRQPWLRGNQKGCSWKRE